MSHLVCRPAGLGLLTAALLVITQTDSHAQVTFRALNDAGFSVVEKDNTQTTKNFAKNTNFVKAVGVYAYPFGGYMNSKFRRSATNAYIIETTCRLVPMYGFKAGHTTGDTTGKAGAQRYELAITTTQKQAVDVHLSFLANIYGASTASFKVTGTGVNESRSWNTSGLHKDAKTLKLTVDGTFKLVIEQTSVCTPGTTNPSYDGYLSSLSVDVNLQTTGAFATFGQGCSTSVMRGSGTPRVDSNYKIHVDKAPAGAPLWLILGGSKDNYGILSLPLPLDYMGAGGCLLNVEPAALLPFKADAQGHAETSFFLSRGYGGRTWYLQWFVADPKANNAGFTLTKGAALSF